MLAKSPWGTAFKTFIAVLLGAAVSDWAGAGVINLMEWQSWVIAALVSSVPVIINFLNPDDSRYGRGSK